MPAPKIVQVALPEGMTSEQFTKLMGTFVKGAVRGKKVGAANTKAIATLKKAHSADFKKYLAEEYVKQGLDPSTIR